MIDWKLPDGRIIKSPDEAGAWCADNELFKGDFYRLRQLGNIETVVDVGAHIGLFCVRLWDYFPEARIIACEPSAQNVECLKLNAPKAEVVEAAVTYDQDVLFHPFPGESMRGGMWQRGVQVGEAWGHGAVVPTVTLEEVLSSAGLDDVSLLKLDCEGSEWSIFRNCGCLNRFASIIGEVHAFAEDGGPARDWQNQLAEFEDLVRHRLPGWKAEFEYCNIPGNRSFFLTRPNSH